MVEQAGLDQMLQDLEQNHFLSLRQLETVSRLAIEVLQQEKNVPNVNSPVTIVGDIHGQYYDLMQIFQICGALPETNFLFLGDYVDRGYSSVECFCYLLIMKVKFRSRVVLLRGNHESLEINKSYGFYDECFRKYNTEQAWLTLSEIFMFLPLAATVENQFFCLHGGLSPDCQKLNQIDQENRF
jgi:serine/threonine-protein phosphatase 2A catalytic subunit